MAFCATCEYRRVSIARAFWLSGFVVGGPGAGEAGRAGQKADKSAPVPVSETFPRIAVSHSPGADLLPRMPAFVRISS